MGLKIISKNYPDKESSDEEYGEWYTHNDITIEGIKIDLRSKYDDVLSGFPIVEGRDYFLVYCVYSTGNSFGREEGCHEYICLYETREKAELLKDQILLDYKKNNGYHSNTLRGFTESGKEFFVPSSVWTGYFEHLDDVVVRAVRSV